MTLVLEMAIFAQKWSKISAPKKVDFWVLFKISSSILLCILGEVPGGGSVALAVGVSDM